MTNLMSLIAILAFAGLAALPADAQEDRNFYDDFQGTSLNPSFRILNPDKQRMALTQGEYLLLVPHIEKKNILEFNGNLPEDYAVTIRIAEPPQHFSQVVRLRVGNLNTYVAAGTYIGALCPTCGIEGPYFYLGKQLDGEQTESIDVRRDELRGKPAYLRLEKNGVEFGAAFSPDGARWESIGKQVLIDPSAKVNLDIYSWAPAPETPIKIDSFEITEILN